MNLLYSKEIPCKPQAPPGDIDVVLSKNIPPPGLYGVGGFAIISIKLPRLAATKPGHADPNRQIKAGTAIIAQPADKRKRLEYEKNIITYLNIIAYLHFGLNPR